MHVQSSSARPHPRALTPAAFTVPQRQFGSGGPTFFANGRQDQGSAQTSGSSGQRGSDVTLVVDSAAPTEKSAFGDKDHPFDTLPAPNDLHRESPFQKTYGAPHGPDDDRQGDGRPLLHPIDDPMLRQRQHRGLQSEKSKLWSIERGADLEDLEDGRFGSDETRIALPVHSRRSSIDSAGSLGYDDDDPRVTGIKREQLDDEVEREAFTRRSMALKNMSYRERKKEAAKMTIQYNVTCTLELRTASIPI